MLWHCGALDEGVRVNLVSLQTYPTPEPLQPIDPQSPMLKRRRPQSLSSCRAEAWAGERLAFSTSRSMLKIEACKGSGFGTWSHDGLKCFSFEIEGLGP